MRNAIYIVPYAVWMALMAFLPATAWAYAVRSAACAVCLCAAYWFFRRGGGRIGMDFKALGIGVLAGIAVWAVWVIPENFAWYREWLVVGDVASESPSPYAPAVCGWPLTLVRLAGSAFVIAAAEELFFRRWLYRWLGADKMAFVWMVALFAVEHNRPAVAAAAGAIYGAVALRRGLSAAIVAHVTTNFILGIQVIATENWAFW